MLNFKKELLATLGYKSGGRQSGTSLYFAVIVMVILLAIVLGLTSILVGQMKMVRQMGYSVIAFSAADAGIERILVERENPILDPPDHYNRSLSNGARYEISILRGELTPGGPEGHCSSTLADWSYCITSLGEYEGVKRGIEVAY